MSVTREILPRGSAGPVRPTEQPTDLPPELATRDYAQTDEQAFSVIGDLSTLKESKKVGARELSQCAHKTMKPQAMARNVAFTLKLTQMLPNSASLW